MPHFTIEYSANLDREMDMRSVCARVHATALSCGLFEPGGIRVRALRCEAHAIADRHPDNAFAHMVLRMGHGRSEAARKAAGDAVFATLEEVFADRLAAPHFGLSFEIVEIDPVLNWKRNSIHARLKGQPGEDMP